MNGSPRWNPRRLAVASLVAASLGATALAAQQSAALPDDVVANVRARVDGGWTPSIVIGVVDSSGARYFAYGRTAPGGGAPADQRTIYEIGSITKVFTGVVLADMAVRGEVALDDPVQRYLPDSVRVPGTDSQPITLRLLSAQRSGLPRLPANFAPRDSTDPYADYDAARLYAFLNGYTPARARLAQGSTETGPAPGWSFDALAGAGALRSTAEDMTTFLAAAMGLRRTPLDSAFRLAADARFDAGPSGVMRIGLGWHVRQAAGGMQIVWHNGGTGGHHSWAGYDPARRVGAVVLTNSPETIDDIGLHLLDPTRPLVVVRAAVTLPPASLDEYVGNYPLAPTFVLTVTRAGDHLMVQATGQPAVRIWASAKDEFFLKVVDAQISFTRGADGRIDALILHQGGRDQRAPRS